MVKRVASAAVALALAFLLAACGGEPEPVQETSVGLPELTPEDLLKQAKKRKNVAKSNFLFRKKHK